MDLKNIVSLFIKQCNSLSATFKEEEFAQAARAEAEEMREKINEVR